MEDLRRALKTEYTPSKASPELNMSFRGGVEPSIGAPFRRCAMNNFLCHKNINRFRLKSGMTGFEHGKKMLRARKGVIESA